MITVGTARIHTFALHDGEIDDYYWYSPTRVNIGGKDYWVFERKGRLDLPSALSEETEE